VFNGFRQSLRRHVQSGSHLFYTVVHVQDVRVFEAVSRARRSIASIGHVKLSAEQRAVLAIQ
jgi:hypothetical protein